MNARGTTLYYYCVLQTAKPKAAKPAAKKPAAKKPAPKKAPAGKKVGVQH